jgi:hypothetical protein
MFRFAIGKTGLVNGFVSGNEAHARLRFWAKVSISASEHETQACQNFAFYSVMSPKRAAHNCELLF